MKLHFVNKRCVKYLVLPYADDPDMLSGDQHRSSLGDAQHQQHRGAAESSGDDSDDREGHIRVGKDYQAVTPSYIPTDQRRPEQTPERALLVWSPSSSISNAQCKQILAAFLLILYVRT